MFISDLTKIEIRKYKNSIPKYIEENYSYLRKEKDNFYTFTSKAYASEELLLNETVITFLKKCDGKHKIVDIEKEISQQFPEVSVKELNRDFMEVLRMMNMLGLIKWLKGENPFMELSEKKINKKVTIRYATENDLSTIVKFYEEFNYNDGYIIFDDYSRDINIERNIVNLRYKLFSFTNELFVLNEKDNIVGIVDVKLPDESKETVAKIISCVIPKSYINDVLEYISGKISKNSVYDITKISSFTLNNDENKIFENALLNNGYFAEAKLVKQVNDNDVTIFSRIV